MSAVINSKRVKPKPDKQKFHHNPLAESDESCDGLEPDSFFGADDGLLGITEYAGNQKFEAESGTHKANGFVKASSVLGKYEVSGYTVCRCDIDSTMFPTSSSHAYLLAENGMPRRKEKRLCELQDQNFQRRQRMHRKEASPGRNTSTLAWQYS